MTIDKNDAKVLYEWWLVSQQGYDAPCCGECVAFAKKLEKLMGREAVMEIKKRVEENPYYGKS